MNGSGWRQRSARHRRVPAWDSQEASVYKLGKFASGSGKYNARVKNEAACTYTRTGGGKAAFATRLDTLLTGAKRKRAEQELKQEEEQEPERERLREDFSFFTAASFVTLSPPSPSACLHSPGLCCIPGTVTGQPHLPAGGGGRRGGGIGGERRG
jgi:hypothetical protein